jgi:peptidoglycan/xylan/chitin deacetylase (PgdA/CDA1 family)
MKIRRFNLLLFLGLFALVHPAVGQKASSQPQSRPTEQWTEQNLRSAVAGMRAGAVLTPKSWPSGARVAVMLSWDMDNETYQLASGVKEPIALSEGQYGAAEALPRIMQMLDRYQIPATFFVPAATGILYPELIAGLKRRPQHEIGLHGWIHEDVSVLNDPDEERRILSQSIDYWTRSVGRRPVGYRAPFWKFSPHTLDLLREFNISYDSSALAMDQPYEIDAYGKPTGIVELPGSWIDDDAVYFMLPGGATPIPSLVFETFRQDFDRAYEDKTLFVLTLHPMFSGRRPHMAQLDKLISYMKSKPGVWFATGRDIAAYVRDNRAVAPKAGAPNLHAPPPVR